MPFELRLSSEVVKLEWGTFSMKRFCDIKNKDISGFIEWLVNGKYSVDDVITVIRAAVEHGSKGLRIVDDFTVSEWIDECGGVLASEGQIVDFFKYIIEKTVHQATAIKGEDTGEKKN